MNKAITFGFLLAFMLQFSSLAYSQDTNTLIRVEYRLKYLKDTTATLFIEEPAELFVDKGKSYFVTTQKSTMDSINFLGLDPCSYIQAKSASLRVLKDYEQEKTTYYEVFFNSDFVNVDEPMSFLAWEVQGDTASMFGYLCQKATVRYGGRDWTAWFTSEVPIPDGPYKFCGHPGLIVRMNDSKERWLIDFVSLSHLGGKSLDLHFLQGARKTSLEGLQERVKDLEENYMERLEAAGRITMPAESRAELIRESREALRKYNNPIEVVSLK